MLTSKVEIVSGSVLITELIKVPREYIESLKACPAFEMVQTNDSVYNLARDLRERCRANGTSVIKTPDALHLASAILSRADEFWTTDGRILNAQVITSEIKICKPHVEQLRLIL